MADEIIQRYIYPSLLRSLFSQVAFTHHFQMSTRGRPQQVLTNSFVISKLPAKTRYFQYEGKFRSHYNDAAVDPCIVGEYLCPDGQ
jgi:hypothetical protein